MGLESRSQALGQEPPYPAEPWYRAYMSVLFEGDPALIVPRIRQAEQLINSRARELCNSRKEFSELRALDNAHSALRALLICRKMSTSECSPQPGFEGKHEIQSKGLSFDLNGHTS